MNNLNKMLSQYHSQKISEQTKIREILQQAALLGLERQGFFEKAAFYGGTALRILYGLDRFSEDLDFTLLQPTENFDFNPFLEGMQRELQSFGFSMEVAQKTKSVETSVISAFMKINTIQLYLTIGDKKRAKALNHNEKIQIKLEVDTHPPTNFRVENRLVLNPVSFYVLTLHQGDLFAGKMHAILHRAWKGRVKGRDWYDLVWYIQNGIALNIECLEKCLKQTDSLKEESLHKDMLLNMLRQKIQAIDWDSAKSDMRTFIPDPERLSIWSSAYFLDLIGHLKIE